MVRELGLAKNSPIEWTNHTFNPWWGCVKVSPACKHCYAEAWARRVGKDVWGVNADRRFFGDKHWDEPLKWNELAKRDGLRHRVFCASMADVFEDRDDLSPWRIRLWALILKTPHLDWLILTKRPENIRKLSIWSDVWPANVWLGVTVENQLYAEQRLPILASLPAAVRFISAEPLLGAVDIEPWSQSIDWIIAGGESGPKARISEPLWFLSLLNQSEKYGIAFHFKQWGDWAPELTSANRMPSTKTGGDGSVMYRIGKKASGRMLSGRTWDGVPYPRAVGSSL